MQDNKINNAAPIGGEPIGPFTAAFVADMARSAGVGMILEEQQFVVLPPGYKAENVTAQVLKGKPSQARKSGVAVLHNIDSFVTYVKDQGMEMTGYIYADIKTRAFTAVFNDFHAQTVAGWRDHRATFKAELTPEAKKWIENNKVEMPQTAFAEFIEDNFVDLAGEFAQTLLEVATTISSKQGINFSSHKRLDNGQNQLVWNEVIDTVAGADGSLIIPKVFTLGVRLFQGDKSGYAIDARLKYRVRNGGVTFWYELDRHERAIEDAFEGYVSKVAEESGYSVLQGSAGA